MAPQDSVRLELIKHLLAPPIDPAARSGMGKPYFLVGKKQRTPGSKSRDIGDFTRPFLGICPRNLGDFTGQIVGIFNHEACGLNQWIPDKYGDKHWDKPNARDKVWNTVMYSLVWDMIWDMIGDMILGYRIFSQNSTTWKGNDLQPRSHHFITFHCCKTMFSWWFSGIDWNWAAGWVSGKSYEFNHWGSNSVCVFIIIHLYTSNLGRLNSSCLKRPDNPEIPGGRRRRQGWTPMISS